MFYQDNIFMSTGSFYYLPVLPSQSHLNMKLKSLQYRIMSNEMNKNDTRYDPEQVISTALTSFPQGDVRRGKLISFFDGKSTDETLLWTNKVDPKSKSGLKSPEDVRIFEIINHAVSQEKPNRRTVTSLDGFGNGLSETVVRTNIPNTWMMRIDGFGGYNLHTVIYKLVKTEALRENQSEWKDISW